MPSVVGPKKSQLSCAGLQMEAEDSHQGTKLILECSKGPHKFKNPINQFATVHPSY